MLTKVKDTLPKQSNVVNHIPCSCGQVYIGETKQRLETKQRDWRNTRMPVRAVWWRNRLWQSMHGRTTTQSTWRRYRCWTGPKDKGNYCWRRPCTSRWHLQRNTLTGTEGWRSWVADIFSAVHGYNFRTIITFTLMMTEAFSQNIGKIFQANFGIRELFFSILECVNVLEC